MTQKQFGERIRLLRKQRGLSQLEFATICNMGAGYIANVENGQRNPRLDTINRFAEGFSMTVGQLLEGMEPVTVAQDPFINRIIPITEKLEDEDKEDLIKIIKLYAKNKRTTGNT